jgi:PIN domain nuclease of toxin-antitoxin system
MVGIKGHQMIKNIFLDTHVIVWLFLGSNDKLSEKVKNLIEKNDLYICPIVILELEYLKEIGRINSTANDIVTDLQAKIGLLIDDLSFEIVSRKAADLTWTRDPFDRLIAASAIARGYPLITKDASILNNLSLATW